MDTQNSLVKTFKNYIKKHIAEPKIQDRGVVEAYDIWAEDYDAQPGNLMLDLDELVFSELLSGIDIKSKTVADIGCGTGRHWNKIFKLKPGTLTGFDVSRGMLDQLEKKYPTAETHVITDDHFTGVKDNSFDIIVSTLTVAHIKNFEEALSAWCRILKPGGDIIITDFHPDALANGGKRTFRNGNIHIAVENYVHPVASIKHLLLNSGFIVINQVEKPVDESVKYYYENKDALHVYEKFKGSPIIYGIHFRMI
jgi:ubiquinone/menaquinone biosynthesis C-methylase UbiE